MDKQKEKKQWLEPVLEKNGNLTNVTFQAYALPETGEGYWHHLYHTHGHHKKP